MHSNHCFRLSGGTCASSMHIITTLLARPHRSSLPVQTQTENLDGFSFSFREHICGCGSHWAVFYLHILHLNEFCAVLRLMPIQSKTNNIECAIYAISHLNWIEQHLSPMHLLRDRTLTMTLLTVNKLPHISQTTDAQQIQANCSFIRHSVLIHLHW